jgi:hypothetical protein
VPTELADSAITVVVNWPAETSIAAARHIQ